MGFDKAALKKDLFSKEIVEMPEWGQSVAIRTISSDERFAYEKIFAKGVEGVKDNYRVQMVALTAVDPESGERIFSTEEDMKLLGKQPARLIDRLFQKAQEVNALSKDEVEKLEKNSETASKDASSSD